MLRQVECEQILRKLEKKALRWHSLLINAKVNVRGQKDKEYTQTQG